MEKTAIYPGSFDPVTYGHLDIIKRGLRAFDRIIVTVLRNSKKQSMFSFDERIKLLRDSTKEIDRITIDSFDGLLVDYAQSQGVAIILRGLRAISDFEYELQLDAVNKSLNPQIETCFMMTSSKYSFLSSSVVKEAAKYGGSISDLVPPVVERALKAKFK